MLFLSLSVLGFVTMEVVAWSTHRFLMHGPLWFLHASHHRPGTGLEANDAFAILFAAASCGAIIAGSELWWPLLPFGIGMTAYGAAYFVLHDMLVHRRLKALPRPKSGYLHSLVRAHLLHHATNGRQGSYGFVLVPPGAADARRVESSIKAVPASMPD